MRKKKLQQINEDLKKERDMLLFFNSQITGVAMTFIGLEQKAEGDIVKEQLSHLFFKFNTLNFVDFFNSIYFKTFKYSGTPPLKLLEEWKEHLEVKLQPVYKELTDKIRNKDNKNSYFQ
ncbi:MAG: hypothetical protein GY853_16415 [PVC group bacterium]|nr:hypothetical protein [PVC group bacterium]